MAAQGSIFSPILVASNVFTSKKLVAYNVFIGESVTRGIFMSVKRGVGLKALRCKLFVIT